MHTSLILFAYSAMLFIPCVVKMKNSKDGDL